MLHWEHVEHRDCVQWRGDSSKTVVASGIRVSEIQDQGPGDLNKKLMSNCFCQKERRVQSLNPQDLNQKRRRVTPLPPARSWLGKSASKPCSSVTALLSPESIAVAGLATLRAPKLQEIRR